MSEADRAIYIIAAIVVTIAATVALTPLPNPRAELEFRGVWSSEFENSTFREGATAETAVRYDKNSYGWLTFSEVEFPVHPCVEDARYDPWLSGDYEITFIGRRLQKRAGHLSGWPAEYVATDVVSVRPIWGTCNPDG